MYRLLKTIIFVVLIILCQVEIVTIGNAADSRYRLLHNDQDALVIGKISEIDEELKLFDTLVNEAIKRFEIGKKI